MDPLTNPYSPGAGSPPPELVGRDPILEQARILLGRTRRGRAEKSMMLTGLRGVGKTVLLNEIGRLAESDGYRTIQIEGLDGVPLAPQLAPRIRALLHSLAQQAGVSGRVRRALAVLRSFVGGLKVTVGTSGEVSFGLDIDPLPGEADSGDLEIDLPSLLAAVGEAAAEKQTALAVFVDEVQYLSEKELGALIMSMHLVQQRQLPVVLVGAGLPILPAMAGRSRSYAERLLAFPDIGPLGPDDAARALREPARAAGVEFESDALSEIVDLTGGYPYFLQEWGYQAWNQAEASPITRATIDGATNVVRRRLDQNFFRVRFDRLTPGERSFLRAMAALGPGPHRSSDVADTLGIKITSMGPVRAKLIKKGMVYSPGHGEIAFTVPLFDEFMRRTMPGEDWRN